MTTFGVHAGLQNIDVGTLRALWAKVEGLGYDWISVWDHFSSADLAEDGGSCLEAVATHAALALDTERVRCGSLVYCVLYRSPAVLANAIATIDHLSGGRADIGLGAGWHEPEFRANGYAFPPVKDRMDALEEAAACIRGLLRDDVTTFEGRHFRLLEARCEPRPLQTALPIWIGGGGETRTLRIAARFADGWNVPFVSPEQFAAKREVLHRHCDDVGREAAEIRCAVNVGLAWSEESLLHQFGGIAEMVRPGVLGGSDAEVLDRIGSYVDAGADQVNIALRAPFDVEALERLADALGLGARTA